MAGVRRERKFTSGGGLSMPDVVLFCCHCRTPTRRGEMTQETNPASPVYGMFSCKRPSCLESPKDVGYLDYGSKDFTDTIGPSTGAVPGVTYNT